MVVQIGPKFIGNYKVHVNEIICSQYYFDNLKKINFSNFCNDN